MNDQALEANFDPGPDYRWEDIPSDTPAAILEALGGGRIISFADCEGNMMQIVERKQ